jgi:hypothetical protein
MADLYIYSTPPEATVELALDDGRVLHGEPCTANGRSDAHRLTFDASTQTQGSVLRATCDGYAPFENRGIFDPSGPRFGLDDIRLTAIASSPTPPTPEPTPPPSTLDDKEAVIHAVYDTGDHDLSTHDGCGQFTEACCEALRASSVPSPTMWGHILKNPGQNQYEGHAVDALMCLAGPDNGIWDIVHDSVAPNASPQCIYKGPPDPALWYYPDAVTGLCLVARPSATVMLTAARLAVPELH